MRRPRTFPLVTAAALLLAACSSGGGRGLATYYDPAGFFTTRLPAANDVTVVPVQDPTEGTPSFLSGVMSSPPQPSPSPQGQTGLGANLAQQSQPSDRTIYQAYAVTTDSFNDLGEMVVYFLAGDPAVDQIVDRDATLAGLPARLVVADVNRDGRTLSTVAAAFTLGENGTGYIVAAVFPQGDWGGEEPDFTKVLRSFRVGIPPVVGTYPLARGGA